MSLRFFPSQVVDHIDAIAHRERDVTVRGATAGGGDVGERDGEADRFDPCAAVGDRLRQRRLRAWGTRTKGMDEHPPRAFGADTARGGL